MAKAGELAPETEARTEEDTKLQRGRYNQLRIVKARTGGWSDRVRGAFLDHLAASCNVRASAACVKRHERSAYYLRRIDPAFAALWDEALKAGYARLEAMLLERAAGLQADGAASLLPIGETEIEEAAFDPELAMRLLANHRAAVKGGAMRGGGPKPAKASEADSEAALLKKLKALKIQIELEEPTDGQVA